MDNHTSLAVSLLTVKTVYCIALLLAVSLYVLYGVGSVGHPNSLIFDEVHLFSHLREMVNNTFFLDTHPPLMKLVMLYGLKMLTKKTQLTDDLFTQLDDIGKVYPEEIPYYSLRMINNAFFLGLIFVTFFIMKMYNTNNITALLTSTFVIFENAYVCLSRTVMLDSSLLFFTGLSIFANKAGINQRPFSSKYWNSYILLACSLGLLLSTKLNAVLVYIGILTNQAYDMWQLICNKQTTLKQAIKHFLSKVAFLVLVPAIIYTALFANYLTIINKHSNNATMMTPQFQAALKENMFVETNAEVVYGSFVMLRHKNTNGGYLHSHSYDYPGGSKQQQVTLYPFKDANNWFSIRKTIELENLDNNSTVTNNTANSSIEQPVEIQHVKDGDVIRLKHLSTGKHLHSHEIRPMMSDKDYLNEVSCYGFKDYAGDSNDYWRVKIINNKNSNNKIYAINTTIQLTHVNTRCGLFSRENKLPKWGFHQQEVMCIKNGQQPKLQWIVELNILPNDLENNTIQPNMISYQKLTMFQRIIEYNKKMIATNPGSVHRHPYSSKPMSWVFLKRGVAMWSLGELQIYLLGNPATWYITLLSILIYPLYLVLRMLLIKRQIIKASQDEHQKIDGIQWVTALYCIYLVNFLPYFVVKRELFLNHYMPAYFIQIILFGLCLDKITQKLKANANAMLFLITTITSTVYLAFYYYTPLTYATLYKSKHICEKSKIFRGWDYNCD